MQIPGFTEEKCNKLEERVPGATLYKYAMTEKLGREKAFNYLFPGADRALFEEQEQMLQCLPLVKLQMKCFVEGEDDIVIGDLLTCKLIVTFPNLKKGQQSGYVCSKTYPYLRRDSWYLIITDVALDGIACVEKLPIDEEVFEKTFLERM